MSTGLDIYSSHSRTPARVKRSAGGIRRPQTHGTRATGGTAATHTAGLLATFGSKFNRFQAVNYTALQQGDPESDSVPVTINNNNNNNNNSNNGSSQIVTGSESSSEEEVKDFFVQRPRRKIRRKMVRNGGYSMRGTFLNGRPNPEHLRLLRDLLNPNTRNNDSDTDEDEPLARNNLTPASIGAQQDCAAAVEKRQKAAAAVAPAEQKVPKTIEEWQEMQEKEDAEILETRKRPEYTMTYSQAVGTEDIYLQMGNRSNASASCEDLLVEIALPEETTPAHKMDLSIMEDEVDLATPIYRLKLPLVHKVDVDRCRAKYDAELRKLSLTLRLKRELDFVNF